MAKRKHKKKLKTFWVCPGRGKKKKKYASKSKCKGGKRVKARSKRAASKHSLRKRRKK